MEKYTLYGLCAVGILGLLVIALFLDTPTGNITNNATVTTSVSLLPPAPVFCTVDLYEGWNFVSFHCIGLASPDAALESIDGSYEKMFYYYATDSSDPWKSYNPSLPAQYTQQLSYIDRMSGYWLYLNANGTLVYNGTKNTAIITLRTGWNMIGYPSNNSRNVSDVLANISFTVLRTYDTPTDTWYIYQNGSANNTLENFTAYKGYWINVTSNQVLTVAP